ncbi:MAG TPA: hypothetical protein VFF65_11720 [Phycisphaerales bacterium]|nr:hypothetical protein [Phycisphaerales bacterium]
MPKKPAKLRPDVAEIAFRTMMEATGQAEKTLPPGDRAEKNAAAVSRGRKGGEAGGKARARRLTPKQRAASARKAAKARWKNKTDN